MAKSFRIPEDAYEGFDALIGIGEESLARLAQHIQTKKLTLETESLIADLARVTGSVVEKLERALETVLIPLSGLRAEFRMPAEEFVELLTRQIADQNPAWHETNQEAWERVSPIVGSLITQNSFFALLYKAYRLLANRPALVENVRLLTELRPVYDDEVTAVKAYLITSTMAASYYESGEQKRVHLTFDKKDLERLQEQVERALRKIALLETQVALLDVPALVAGTEKS